MTKWPNVIRVGSNDQNQHDDQVTCRTKESKASIVQTNWRLRTEVKLLES